MSEPTGYRESPDTGDPKVPDPGSADPNSGDNLVDGTPGNDVADRGARDTDRGTGDTDLTTDGTAQQEGAVTRPGNSGS